MVNNTIHAGSPGSSTEIKTFFYLMLYGKLCCAITTQIESSICKMVEKYDICYIDTMHYKCI